MVELAQKQFIYGNYEDAIISYSKLIDANPNDYDLFLSRAICYIELSQYDEAIKDLEKADKLKPNVFQTHFRYGIALFWKAKFGEALTYLKIAESLASLPHEKNYVSAWINKCLKEQGFLNASVLNSAATMPSSGKIDTPTPTGMSAVDKRLEYDWYQNATTVTIVFKIKGYNKNNVKVNIGSNDVGVVINLQDGKTYEYDYSLNNEIIPEQSTYSIDEKKVELKLKKRTDAVQWPALEKVKSEIPKAKPSYPSSSKKKVDWDKLDKNITKEEAKEKPEGDEALNSLFKAIYEKADENTRRAMIKSFQTSGGTVLSTNWSEVKDKDYEGKDRPEAPKGQQWKKPEM